MSAETNYPTQRTSLVRLLALHAQANPAVKELNQVVTILGAGDGADLILGSSRIDAAHCALVSLAGGIYVCDLGAPGGTLLGGRPVRWSRLGDGDEVAIGPFSFRVQVDESLDEIPVEIPVFQLRHEQTIGTIVSRSAALIIGSDPNCDVVLTGASISPRHALVVWTRDGAMVRDLTGRSSVRCNGRPVQMGAIVDGDAIGVGPYELIYELQAAVAGAASFEMEQGPVAQPRGFAPTRWLDESQVELLPSKTEAADDSSFDLAGDYAGSYENNAGDDPTCDALRREMESDEDWAEPECDETPESRSAFVEQCPPQFRERIVAAQRALDERAMKLRRELEAERAQLKAYQEKLQEQARQLLDATRQNQQGPIREEVVRHDQSFDEPVAADMEQRTAVEAAPREEGATTDHASSLQDRVSELVKLVRDEKEEMYRAENRLESMRFDIERLRGSVLRAKEKHRVQEAEHEARYADLKRGQSVIGQEREALLARMRRLESREAALVGRIQEADRMRKELDGEAERLNRAQEEHDERLRELRINLEGERHRLRVRQAELQRKAADLAKVAQARRKAIEEIVTHQHSQLREKESELKARQTAVTEAGRAELERAATDLEKLLSTRLADVESEVLSRQEKLDNWLKSIWDTAKPMTEPAGSALQPSFRVEPFVSRMPVMGPSTAAERGQMALLEKELQGLHRAVRRLEGDSDQRSVWQDVDAPAQGATAGVSGVDSSNAVFPSKFSERIASIRRGLMDLGSLESRKSTFHPEKSVGIEY
ncbi:MAG TPA: FHA domain-containing protein [Phycisphaerae bacterium]|nr:FHA domain-containing protein [Phycisphaerae bacterium]